MKLAIGAIFRDEFDYIIEWLCWHEMAGFSVFYIADNSSSDGTRELLEALAEIGKIKVLYQPIVEEQAQVRAYNRIAQISVKEADAILFIDADEFLIHESMVDGAEFSHLHRLLESHDVGMVGINWRCFGSSGQKTQDNRPVVERFTSAASDASATNNHIKSISKTRYIHSISPHNAVLNFGYCVKPDASVISDFIVLKDSEFVSADHSGRTQTISASPLRVNHYVVKSQQEFMAKKQKRGDAMLGVNHKKSIDYFNYHDFKEAEYVFPQNKICRLKARINELAKLVQHSTFGKTLKGVLDRNDRQGVRGWLIDEAGESANLKVNIFVNDVFVGSALCGFYRPDLKEKKISVSGLSGFRWDHPKPLRAGDVVEVLVHANRFRFADRSRTVIGTA